MRVGIISCIFVDIFTHSSPNSFQKLLKIYEFSNKNISSLKEFYLFDCYQEILSIFIDFNIFNNCSLKKVLKELKIEFSGIYVKKKRFSLWL